MQTKELIVGGTSTSADTDQFPRITNGVLGTKMKIVTPAIRAATRSASPWSAARSRAAAAGLWSSVKSTHQKWLDEKKFTVLVQLALEKHPDLPDVPLITISPRPTSSGKS